MPVIHDIPALILGITVNTYWLCVVIMSIRVRRRAGGISRVWMPEQRREQLMWAIWIPTLATWMHLPFAAAIEPAGTDALSGVPVIAAAHPLLHAMRWAGAVIAVAGLGLSIVCWRHMGAAWRMGVDSDSSRLIDDGPFAWARHPIYALGSLIMVCSVIILPAPAMLVVATIHITLLNLKARNEERFLRQRFGESYESYCRNTGRFIPRFRKPRPAPDRNHANGPQNTGLQSQPAVRSDSAHEMNIFQRVMLMWEEVQPYNAAHAVRIKGPADAGKLREAIQQACRARGIGEVTIDQANRSLAWSALDDIDIETASVDRENRDTLPRVLTDGLNMRFADTPCRPFRWWIMEEEGLDAHEIVLWYRHVVADGRSIEQFLGDVLRRYSGSAIASNGEPTTSCRSDHADWRAEKGGRFRGFLRSARLTRLMRSNAFSFPEEKSSDRGVHVVIRSAPEGLATDLASRCKARGIGITDAFLAALGAAILETPAYCASRQSAPHFALGTVVPDRSDRSNGCNGLGVRLHNLVVMLKRPNLGFDKMLDEIAAQTSWYKRHPEAVRSVSTIRVRWAKHVWPALGIRNERDSYRKYFPICAGLSTVRIDPSRFGGAASGITRYTRAAPTGPTTSVVVSPTIFGDRLEFSITAMNACLEPAESRALLDGVIQSLSAFVQGEHSVPAGVGSR